MSQMERSLRVYNSLSRTLEDFEPRDAGRVGMYVCGMTVYDYCHIGHARAMISFDVVYRWLVERGFDVTFVRNYTDVDDKIIERANRLGEDPVALAARFVEELDADLEHLGLAIPQVQPKVSEHIDDIISVIEKLMANGHAYSVDGDVFYEVRTFKGYGKLSGKKLDDLRAGERVAVDSRKRDPADFALWKSAKPGEPSWDSPWGPGRPGWHIECSAMSMRYLGESFDIHGGGIDLVFPHHENEIAQSEGAHPGHRPYARYWMHNGHLTLEAEKMSKSLGNIVRIRDITRAVPGEALRMLYLQSHYRSPLPYSSARLEEALGGLDRAYHAKELLEEMAALPVAASVDELVRDLGGPAADLADAARNYQVRFAEAMDEDFNTGKALGLFFELARAVNRFGNNRKWRKRGAALAAEALEAFAVTGRVLGIGGMAAVDWFSEVRARRLEAIGKTESEIESRVAARNTARADKDWAAADTIRDELAALGVVIMDEADGTHWRMQIS